MSFLTDKFKGKYRLRAPIDTSTNDFPREYNGNFADTDIYIDCSNGIQVGHYGHGVLEAYIPSLGRGRNIVKAIYSDFIKPIEESNYFIVSEKEKDGETIETISFDYESLYKDPELNKIIHSIIESDEEVLFRFKWDKMEKFEKYFKPKTSAAGRSPFSNSNLPKCNYTIPEEDLVKYKFIASKIPKDKLLMFGRLTTSYINSLAKNKKKQEEIKADMKKCMLKGKEYIHYIGKWDSYLKYLEIEVDKII